MLSYLVSIEIILIAVIISKLYKIGVAIFSVSKKIFKNEFHFPLWLRITVIIIINIIFSVSLEDVPLNLTVVDDADRFLLNMIFYVLFKKLPTIDNVMTMTFLQFLLKCTIMRL